MQKDFGEKPSVMMVEDIGKDDDLQIIPEWQQRQTRPR
jgi:hypothetical protein